MVSEDAAIEAIKTAIETTSDLAPLVLELINEITDDGHQNVHPDSAQHTDECRKGCTPRAKREIASVISCFIFLGFTMWGLTSIEPK